MIARIVILAVIYILFLAMIWSCCKVAADADKQSEEIMKAMEKTKIEWVKPELVELGCANSVAKALLTKGNEILCHDCFTGKNAGLTCYKGVGVK